MTTPWINHSKMKQISSKQMPVFKTSRSKVQNISIAMNLNYIKEEHTVTKNNICELDTVSSCANIIPTNNPQENDEINKVFDLHEKNYKDSTSELHELSDGKNSKHTSKVDLSTEIEIIYKLANSTDCKHNSTSIPADETNDTPQKETTFEHQPPSESDVMDEMKEFLEIDEMSGTNLAEETNDSLQTESSFEHQPPSESDVIDEMNELFEKDEMGGTNLAEETNDSSQTESPFKHQPPSESDFMDGMNELLKKNEMSGTNLAEETNDSPQTESPFEHQPPSESDFIDEMNELLKKDKISGTNLAEETNDSPQTESPFEHQPPSESDFVDEMNELIDEIDEMDETIPDDETNDSPQAESPFELWTPSTSDFLDEMNELLDQGKMGETNPADLTSEFHNYVQGKVFFMTKKSPFSIHVKIDDFLHFPICGDIVQNTFEFLDLNNKQTPQFNTKLFNTTTYYPEQPDCRLVCSKIHENIFFTEPHTYDTNNKNNYYKTVAIPLHNSVFMKTGETNDNSYTSHDFMHIRVPVVLGEYKIEVCLEENVVFEEEVIRVKEISKEVVLTNYKFVPSQFSQSLGNGTCKVVKGNLFIEGYLHQKIEYTALLNKNAGSIQKNSVTHLNQLCQKMVLELIIHLLQIQQVRVIYEGKGSKRNPNEHIYPNISPFIYK